MPNGKKARKAVVFGLNGVLEPVNRNCDVINRPRRYVSQHISSVNTTEPSGPSSYSSHNVKILKQAIATVGVLKGLGLVVTFYRPVWLIQNYRSCMLCPKQAHLTFNSTTPCNKQLLATWHLNQVLIFKAILGIWFTLKWEHAGSVEDCAKAETCHDLVFCLGWLYFLSSFCQSRMSQGLDSTCKLFLLNPFVTSLFFFM